MGTALWDVSRKTQRVGGLGIVSRSLTPHHSLHYLNAQRRQYFPGGPRELWPTFPPPFHPLLKRKKESQKINFWSWRDLYCRRDLDEIPSRRRSPRVLLCLRDGDEISPRWKRSRQVSSLMRSPRELGEICYVSEINSPRSRQELNEICSGPY